MALPLNTGGSCPIISTPSLNVTGSGYYTTAKRNNFILINQIRSYLFYSLKIPSLIEKTFEDFTVFEDKVFKDMHKKRTQFQTECVSVIFDL